MTSHPYWLKVRSVLSRQQSKCLNHLGNIIKFCTNKKNNIDIKVIIDSQVKVCWEEWLENTKTLINTLFVLDSLFYNPNRESMSETDLEDKRPEWKDSILPRMKSSYFVFLFPSESYEVMYDELTKPLILSCATDPLSCLKILTCLQSPQVWRIQCAMRLFL